MKKATNDETNKPEDNAAGPEKPDRDTPKRPIIKVFFSLLVKGIKNPAYILKNLNVHSLRTLYYTLKTRDTKRLQRSFDAHITGQGESGGAREQLRLYQADPATEKISLPVPIEKPLVSIIIPTYNQLAFTLSCIKAIRENTPDVPYEAIIIDDCSTDQTKTIEALVQNIRVIHNQANMGFLRSCNLAAEAASGEYLLFLNNDTNVQPDWLKPLLEVFQRDERAGLVGAKLVYPDGKLQEAGGILWSDGSAMNYGRYDQADKPEYNYVRETDYISGAAIMIRKSLWKSIGGFDERYRPAYYEDSDLAMAVRAAGYKVLYQPKSVVVHFEGISCGRNPEAGIKKNQIVNRDKFLDKWKDVLKTSHAERAAYDDPIVFKARERGIAKKVILVCDQNIPQYDKDAGSRTLFMYMKQMLGMGLIVKFMPALFRSAEPYLSELLQMGIEVLCSARYQRTWKHWVKKYGREIDYVLLHRAEVAKTFLGTIKKHSNARIVYDVCDLQSVRSMEQYRVSGDIVYKENARIFQKIEKRLFDRADVVATLSTKEMEVIHQSSPRKKVVQWPIFCFEDPETERKCAETRDIIFVGGFQHPPNVDAMSWFVNDVLPLIRRQLPDLVLNIAGSRVPDEIYALQGDNVHVLGQVTDGELAALYRQSRLCVAPLRFGAGVKGKIIEAMRFGVPVVTTSVGTEGIDGLDDILKPADTCEEFAERLIRLYNDIGAIEDLSRRSTLFVRDICSPAAFLKAFNASYLSGNGQEE